MLKKWMFGSLLSVSCLLAGEFQLEMSAEEKGDLEEIVRFVSETAEEDLMKLSEQVAPKIMKMMKVSPFQILAHIASDRELTEAVLLASESPLKWGMLVRGFSIRMNQEALRPEFDQRMADFLDYLSLDESSIKETIEKKEWGNFIVALLRQV